MSDKAEVAGFSEAVARAEQVKSLVFDRLHAEREKFSRNYTDLIRLPLDDFRTMQYLYVPQALDVFRPAVDFSYWLLFDIVCEGWRGDYVQLLHEMEHLA